MGVEVPIALALYHVHAAFLWGGPAVMLSLPFCFAIGKSDAWLSIARWLTN
jgi:hypothetical protein